MPAYRHADSSVTRSAGGSSNDAPNSFVWEIGHTSQFTSPGVAVLPAGRPDLRLVQRDYVGRHVADPDQVGDVRRRLDGEALGRRERLRRQGGGRREYCGAANYGKPFCIYRGTRSESSGLPLRGRLPGHDQRLRQGEPVPDDAPVRRAVRPELDVLRDADQVATDIGRPGASAGPAVLGSAAVVAVTTAATRRAAVAHALPPFIDGCRCTILMIVDESHRHTPRALLRPRTRRRSTLSRASRSPRASRRSPIRRASRS